MSLMQALLKNITTLKRSVNTEKTYDLHGVLGIVLESRTQASKKRAHSRSGGDGGLRSDYCRGVTTFDKCVKELCWY